MCVRTETKGHRVHVRHQEDQARPDADTDLQHRTTLNDREQSN